MLKILLFSLLLAAAPTLCAQTIYFDDFEGGNFLNPEWVGDTSDFLVQNGQLLQVDNNRTVSPDGDGFEDELTLAYGTEAAGYRLRLRVFDVQGRPVRDLGEVDLLIGEGNIVWDGLADNGVWPGRGAYVLLAEVTKSEGEREVQKFAVVVAGLR